MLPSSYTSADMGRVTSGAAMALLGKIYLTFHKWTEARNVLSQLVGRYSLMTTPEQVFDVNNKMNDEIILLFALIKMLKEKDMDIGSLLLI